MDETHAVELLFNQLKPFSRYHACIIGLMSYVAVLCGALMAFPIFGQYASASYCELSSINSSSFDGFLEQQQSIMDNSSAYSINCFLKEEYCSFNNNSAKCKSYIFDDDPMTETIVSRYNLGCEKSVQNTLITSLIFVGYCIGSAVGGGISDRYGRIHAIKVFCACFLVISGALCFFDNLVTFAIMRIIQVALIVGSFGPMITYTFEICGPSYRSKITVVATGLPWSLGYAYVATIAKITRHWWWTLFYLIAGTIPFPILVHFLVPESFLFLCSSGNTAKARKVIEKFPQNPETDEEKFKIRTLEPDGEFLNSITSFASIRLASKTSPDQPSGLKGLFANKYMTLSFILLVIIWICVSVLFNGLLYYMGKLPGSIFTNVYYTCLMDCISYFAAYFLVPKMTRRAFVSSAFLLAAVGCYSGSFISTFSQYQYLIRWFALISKLGVCGLYSAVFLVAAELFPTPVRSTATALGMAFCTIGGFISPLIIDLDLIAIWLPYFIFGSCAVLGAGLALIIPETKGMEMMNTLQEGYIFHESAFKSKKLFRKS